MRSIITRSAWLRTFTMLSLISAFMFTFPACKRKATFSGRVIDPLTSRGVPDIKVTVKESKLAFGDKLKVTTWSQTTGPDGEFVIDYRAKGGRYEHSFFLETDESAIVDTLVAIQKAMIYIPRDEDDRPLAKGKKDVELWVSRGSRIILYFKNPNNKPLDMVEVCYNVNGVVNCILGSSGGMAPASAFLLPGNGEVTMQLNILSSGVPSTHIEKINVEPFGLARYTFVFQ